MAILGRSLLTVQSQKSRLAAKSEREKLIPGDLSELSAAIQMAREQGRGGAA